MNKLKAVFWDVDGTIADTELCGHRVAFNLAFNDFDLDWYWNENTYLDLLRISGGLKRIIYFRDVTNSEINYNTCSEIQKRKRFHYKELIKSGKINVRDGVIRLIKELGKLEIDQFIVTTSGRESLEPFLDSSLKSYLKYFTKIITYEDVDNHKPLPDAYNLAKKISKHSNESCIAIEDSKIGVYSATSANINCLLTLAPWVSDTRNITKKANACVDRLGDEGIDTKLIYGKPLISNKIDFEYLSNIIN